MEMSVTVSRAVFPAQLTVEYRGLLVLRNFHLQHRGPRLLRLGRDRLPQAHLSPNRPK
jgi:hypothetical protein